MIYEVTATKIYTFYVQANSGDEACSFVDQEDVPNWEDHAIRTELDISSDELNGVNVTWLDRNFNPVD
jgi:hypothetical protein